MHSGQQEGKRGEEAHSLAFEDAVEKLQTSPLPQSPGQNLVTWLRLPAGRLGGAVCTKGSHVPVRSHGSSTMRVTGRA